MIETQKTLLQRDKEFKIKQWKRREFVEYLQGVLHIFSIALVPLWRNVILLQKRSSMNTLSQIFVALLAVEHLYILWLEMFMWTTPLGRRTFSAMPSDLFEKTKGLAANQGLYNGFLAAGLIWSLFISDPVWSKNVALFFTSCIIAAGLFGAATAMRKIFFTQALPAIITLVILLLF